MFTSHTTTRRTVGVLLVACLTLVACGDGTESATTQSTADATTVATDDVGQTAADSETPDTSLAETQTASGTDYLASYTLTDEEFGTMVTVTVDDATRSIVTNALPDHETGEFPNEGNPNTITAQDLTWEFPTEPTFTGEATATRTSGVAVNGVKFEPGTAETLTCESGETYRIEALQDLYDLGLDFNNAHVQPTGEYHYHGVSQLLVDAYDSDDDLALIGFAADGHLIYYSKSDAYRSSYVLDTTGRSGTGCEASGPFADTIDVDGTTPDGTYTSDWIFDEAGGDLDECNGTTIDGEYVYLATDAYPFITRCLMGDVSGVAGVGAGPGEPGAAGSGGLDLAGVAETLGVTEEVLLEALGNPPDIDAAAETLGIPSDELAALMPPPPDAAG